MHLIELQEQKNPSLLKNCSIKNSAVSLHRTVHPSKEDTISPETVEKGSRFSEVFMAVVSYWHPGASWGRPMLLARCPFFERLCISFCL